MSKQLDGDELERLLRSPRKEDRARAVQMLEDARAALLREMDEDTLRELKASSQRNLTEAREELASGRRELGARLDERQVELLKQQEQLSLEEITALDQEMARRKPN